MEDVLQLRKGQTTHFTAPAIIKIRNENTRLTQDYRGSTFKFRDVLLGFSTCNTCLTLCKELMRSMYCNHATAYLLKVPRFSAMNRMALCRTLSRLNLQRKQSTFQKIITHKSIPKPFSYVTQQQTVLWIRICRIRMFLGFPDLDPS
jgi:hypothetical protein